MKTSCLVSYFRLSQTYLRSISVLLLSTAAGISVSIATVQASERQPTFTHAPRLVRSASSFNSPYADSTYQFTLRVPEDAGAPLKAVSIQQQLDLNPEKISFEASQTHASQGKRIAKGTRIPLASIGGAESANGEVTVVFEQPVQPGSTVTIALEPLRNPSTSGTYLFAITAFPVGDEIRGIPLGYGRLEFEN